MFFVRFLCLSRILWLTYGWFGRVQRIFFQRSFFIPEHTTKYNERNITMTTITLKMLFLNMKSRNNITLDCEKMIAMRLSFPSRLLNAIATHKHTNESTKKFQKNEIKHTKYLATNSFEWPLPFGIWLFHFDLVVFLLKFSSMKSVCVLYLLLATPFGISPKQSNH